MARALTPTQIREALEFEDHVKDELERRGWVTVLIGQRVLPEEMARLISSLDLILRYAPDMLAVRESGTANRPRICGVDAKAGKAYQQTGLHSANADSVAGLERWAVFHKVPVFLVFHDMTAIRTDRFLTYADKAPSTANGTGKPSLRIPMDRCLSLDKVFGRPTDIHKSYPQMDLLPGIATDGQTAPSPAGSIHRRTVTDHPLPE
jgi:hypothetical protein